MAAQRILVTGANKGIGLALVEKILERPDTFVYLAARSPARGEEARTGVVARNPSAQGRLAVLELDVTSDESVSAAAARVAGLYRLHVESAVSCVLYYRPILPAHS